MAKPVRTTEFDTFCRTLKCPNGHRQSMRFIEGDGEILDKLHFRDRLLLDNPTTLPDSRWTSMRTVARLRSFNHELFGGVAIQRFRADSQIECRRCEMRWNAFVPERPSLRVVTRRGLPFRYTEPIGRDIRTLDRRNSAVPTTAIIELEKTWSARSECVWDRETKTKTTTSGTAKGSLGVVELGGEARREIEQRIRTTSTQSTETTQRSKHTIEVPIPARTVATVTINWKQVWEEVAYEVELPDGRSATVPFRRTVDVIFDESLSHNSGAP